MVRARLEAVVFARIWNDTGQLCSLMILASALSDQSAYAARFTKALVNIWKRTQQSRTRQQYHVHLRTKKDSSM